MRGVAGDSGPWGMKQTHGIYHPAPEASRCLELAPEESANSPSQQKNGAAFIPRLGQQQACPASAVSAGDDVPSPGSGGRPGHMCVASAPSCPGLGVGGAPVIAAHVHASPMGLQSAAPSFLLAKAREKVLSKDQGAGGGGGAPRSPA